MAEQLNKQQLKTVWDNLFCGDLQAADLMRKMSQYEDCHACLLWFVRNNIRGKGIVDFFKEASGDDENQGVLLGMQYIINRINGRKFTTEKLTLGNLK